ncbi:MAG: SHOCT domain-containing protein [Bulleidia sp.]|nr:SHOCT domain-containing protein [Bulleidia sp.]
MALFKKIARAEVLGTNTLHQTHLFTTHNFTCYTFLIHYTDGSQTTEELTPDENHKDRKRYRELVKYIQKEDPMDQLQKAKELYDQGILSEQEYKAQVLKWKNRM